MLSELGVDAGQVIAGKYRLKKLLGRGGMGSVWLCEDLALLSTVALKVIKPDVARNANSVARFMREAKAAAMLRSPHVVQILEHGQEGAIAYIAMELLEGESLYQRLKTQGRLSPTETATVMTHVGRAMQKAHDAGIVHRDLKPDNIFLVRNDDEIIGKVLDFGIAKSSAYSLNQTGESPRTQTGALLGTPYYMSPEQATGQKNVDHRSDLWAIAVIAFECLIGRRPYQSDSLGDLVLQICSRPQPVPSHLGRVPIGFDAWFEKAQDRDPDARFQSAKELTRALREVLTGSSRGSGRSLPRPSVPPPRRAPVPSRPPPPPATADSGGGLPAPAMPFDTPPLGSAPRISGVPATTSPSGSVSGAFAHAEATAGSGSGLAGASPSGLVGGGQDDAAGVGLGLETLDPLAATTAPKRRRGLLVGGVIGVIGVVGGIGAGLYLGRAGNAPISPPTSASPADSTLVDGTQAASSPAASSPADSHAAPPASQLAASSSVASAASVAPSATTSASTSSATPAAPLPRAVPRPPPTRPQPPPPAQPPRAQPPPPPPPPQDPLGI